MDKQVNKVGKPHQELKIKYPKKANEKVNETKLKVDKIKTDFSNSIFDTSKKLERERAYQDRLQVLESSPAYLSSFGS